jgi:hypothetical protein
MGTGLANGISPTGARGKNKEILLKINLQTES